MNNVTYIDRHGLGVLIAKLVSVRNKSGDAKRTHMTPRSHHVFETCKLGGVFGGTTRRAARQIVRLRMALTPDLPVG